MLLIIKGLYKFELKNIYAQRKNHGYCEKFIIINNKNNNSSLKFLNKKKLENMFKQLELKDKDLYSYVEKHLEVTQINGKKKVEIKEVNNILIDILNFNKLLTKEDIEQIDVVYSEKNNEILKFNKIIDIYIDSLEKIYEISDDSKKIEINRVYEKKSKILGPFEHPAPPLGLYDDGKEVNMVCIHMTTNNIKKSSIKKEDDRIWMFGPEYKHELLYVPYSKLQHFSSVALIFREDELSKALGVHQSQKMDYELISRTQLCFILYDLFINKDKFIYLYNINNNKYMKIKLDDTNLYMFPKVLDLPKDFFKKTNDDQIEFLSEHVTDKKIIKALEKMKIKKQNFVDIKVEKNKLDVKKNKEVKKVKLKNVKDIKKDFNKKENLFNNKIHDKNNSIDIKNFLSKE